MHESLLETLRSPLGSPRSSNNIHVRDFDYPPLMETQGPRGCTHHPVETL